MAIDIDALTESELIDLNHRIMSRLQFLRQLDAHATMHAITREKVELGKMLFFDTRLSASQIISCYSCDDLSNGGVDAGPTSIGHGWQKGPRPGRPFLAVGRGSLCGIEITARTATDRE
jgi:cytochrome c peroxidase